MRISIAAYKVIAEADYLFALFAHRSGVAVVGDLDYSGGRGWCQQRLLELNLLKEQLVSLEWW